MDQRKEAVFRYIDEHRQEILEDWKALVNHEGSLRQPDAMHAEAEYLADASGKPGWTVRLSVCRRRFRRW